MKSKIPSLSYNSMFKAVEEIKDLEKTLSN